MTSKPLSVRSQRSFQEHMKTLYQGIDNQLYAAEQSCQYSKELFESHTLGNRSFKVNDYCKGCDFKGHFNLCSLFALRVIVGNHFVQSDIKETELTE